MRQGRKSKEERGNYRIKQLKKEKEKKMTNVNESGRSMVEMLGVLAIIGVLSIGGIAGYTMAMNRYRANEILDAASKVAIIAMTGNGGVGKVIQETDVATEVGIGTLPCDAKLSSTADGVVTAKLTGCSEVVTVMNSIAGSRTNSCTGTTCVLDFSGTTSAIKK